jgi:RHH-type proline utilization regulon transcriptional repressor/proline dehydrogenase/delta 1-pyrroline-5-carboxylate dehydrogenase
MADEHCSEVERVTRHYQCEFEGLFREARDLTGLSGQDNFLRYVPARIAAYLPAYATGLGQTLRALIRTMAGSWVSGSKLSLFADRSRCHEPIGAILSGAAAAHFVTDAAEMARVLTELRPERVRVLGNVADELRAGANEAHVYLTSEPPLASGRVELLFHLLEQSVSVTCHRYGNLGLREVRTSRNALVATPRLD